MGTLQEIERAIAALPPAELARFRDWFRELDAQRWDQQIEQDAQAGRLDALADEAVRDLRAGRCTDL